MNGVIVLWRIDRSPRKEKEALELVRNRVPTVRREGLVTDRTPTIMRAREVSEWKSQEAIDAAHKNPDVLAMWNEFFEVCDCVPLNTLSKSPRCLLDSSRFQTD